MDNPLGYEYYGIVLCPYGTYQLQTNDKVEIGDMLYYYYNSSDDFGYTTDKNKANTYIRFTAKTKTNECGLVLADIWSEKC